VQEAAPEELYERSRELVADDRLGENAELLREAVGRFPDDTVLLLTGAAAVFAVGSEDEAKGYVRRAAELSWDDPGRLTWAASLMLNLKEFGEAKDLAVRATAIAPDDFELTGDLAFVMGRVALAFEQDDAAERALRSAFELEPGRPGRGELLAELLGRTGRPTEALEVLAEALRHRPDDEALTRIRETVLGGFQGDATGAQLQSVLRALRAGEASAYDVRDALHGADVYVPHSGEPGDADVTLSTIRDDDGETIPLFSSADTMAAALGPDHAHLQVPFAALVSGWPEGVDAVVDPGTEWALRLPAHTLTPPH
jgi:tetratricopeptide (TPR) repeat protein